MDPQPWISGMTHRVPTDRLRQRNLRVNARSRGSRSVSAQAGKRRRVPAREGGRQASRACRHGPARCRSPAGPQVVHRWWYRQAQAAGLVGRGVTSGLNMHQARHTFAMELRRVARHRRRVPCARPCGPVHHVRDPRSPRRLGPRDGDGGVRAGARGRGASRSPRKDRDETAG